MRRSMDKMLISFAMLIMVCFCAPVLLSDHKPTSVARMEAQADTEVQYLSENYASGETTENVEAQVELTEEEVTEYVAETVETQEKTTGAIVVAESTVEDTCMLDAFLNEDAADNNSVDDLIEAKRESRFVYPEVIAYIKTLPCEIKPSSIPAEEQAKAEAIRANEKNFAGIVETYYAEKAKSQKATPAQTAPAQSAPAVQYASQPGDGVLTASKGVNYGPSGKETYYNLNMNGVVNIMQGMGYNEQYWVRDDGVKMYGDYVMVAANLNTHPRGSIVESSLGPAIVVDTGGFAASDPNQLDIATSW